jgi:transcriptional regulator with XRE-family HTH domain
LRLLLRGRLRRAAAREERAAVFQHLAVNLQRIRRDRRLSQPVLGLRSGVPQQRISDYERGLRPRDLRDIGRLAKALDVDVANLLAEHVVIVMPAAAARNEGQAV